MTFTDLRAQLKQSMLDKNADRTSVIRMLLTAMSYAAMSKSIKDDEMTEDDINSVILKEVKTRSEAIDEMVKTDKTDSLDKENLELSILKEFAPAMMSEEEVLAEVQKILGEADPNIQMGPAIGLVMKSLKNKAEPSVVSKYVAQVLKK